MKGTISGINEHYALVKLPDGRSINMKVSSLEEKSHKGQEIEIKGAFEPIKF